LLIWSLLAAINVFNLAPLGTVRFFCLSIFATARVSAVAARLPSASTPIKTPFQREVAVVSSAPPEFASLLGSTSGFWQGESSHKPAKAAWLTKSSVASALHRTTFSPHRVRKQETDL
jgi:hypothetical protein